MHTVVTKIPHCLPFCFHIGRFEVSEASLVLELCKGAMRLPDGKIVTARANLLVSEEDERSFVIIRKADELDETPMYHVVTASPYVEIVYDWKRKTASRYKMKFYIEVSTSTAAAAVLSPRLTKKKKRKTDSFHSFH